MSVRRLTTDTSRQWASAGATTRLLRVVATLERLTRCNTREHGCYTTKPGSAKSIVTVGKSASSTSAPPSSSAVAPPSSSAVALLSSASTGLLAGVMFAAKASMVVRMARLGYSSDARRGRPVVGSAPRSRIHRSMANFSYVTPEGATTGLAMIACVMGHVSASGTDSASRTVSEISSDGGWCTVPVLDSSRTASSRAIICVASACISILGGGPIAHSLVDVASQLRQSMLHSHTCLYRLRRKNTTGVVMCPSGRKRYTFSLSMCPTSSKLRGVSCALSSPLPLAVSRLLSSLSSSTF
mmetsp:Transcript_2481/g.6174  ORF Transcript_2481/g.6174 Transcript_2481/m.6174 type:complete len:298 (+) Transcript_2481:517-1410(+)